MKRFAIAAVLVVISALGTHAPAQAAAPDWREVKQWAEQRKRTALAIEERKGYDGRYAYVKANLDGIWRVYEDLEARSRAADKDEVFQLKMLWVYGNIIPTLFHKTQPELPLEVRISQSEMETALAPQGITIATLR